MTELNIEGGAKGGGKAYRIYGVIRGGIDDVIKNNLTEVSYYKISDIGRKGLKTAIKKLKTGSPKAEQIKKALLANISEVEAFIDNNSGLILKETHSYRKPRITNNIDMTIDPVQGGDVTATALIWENEQDYKGLLKYFRQTEHTSVATAETIAKQQARYDQIKADLAYKGKSVFNPEPSKVGDTFTFKGYEITDVEALQEAIKQQIKPTVSYSLDTPQTDDKTLKDQWGELDSTLLAVAELNKIIGVERGGDTYATEQVNTKTGSRTVTYGGRVTDPAPDIKQTIIYLDDVLTRDFIVWALADIKRKAELVGEGVGREVVNIKDADQHRYIGRPSTMGLMDMITKAVEGKDLNDLKERYLDQESRNADGGFLLHIDNPQTALPLAFDKDDITPRQQAKMVANSVALTVQSLGALQAYRRDNPDSDGYIKLKDLAKYVKRYADDMAIKGSLRPQYRQQLLNGLTLATLAGTSYIISRDKKTGKARHGVVYLIDRISEYETNKKGDIIAVKTDFTQEYKASLQYNLGVLTDGVQNLDRTEPINLATYILDRQVAKQNDTIAGKPIKCRADKLCKVAGITDQTVTNRYNTLAKILNELQAEGVAVGRWTTEAKGNTITGYNPDSQKLYIYPTKAVQTTYTTKERTKAVREAYKTEQKARLKALKKYAKGYTDLDVLAKEMDISRHQLDELLAGQQPITVHLMGLIDTEIANT